MSNKKILPMGVQDFEKLVNNNCIYVDKTAYIYKLVHDVAPFFLSRPRRFGKSLLLSALKAYWEGRKDLFAGLEIEKLEADNPDAWHPYPVFYFDFNGKDYSKTNSLEEVLDSHLKDWEHKYDIITDAVSVETRFKNLLVRVKEKTGKRCVVLVDEYDKPLLDLINDPELQEHNKSLFKGFFSNLKSCDACIQFVFITGVTKFHKVSIFSDLNQLIDISLNKEFSALCGITENELNTYFSEHIELLAKSQDLTIDECRKQLKQTYDGYHFYPDSEGVYNPFSIINAFYAHEFRPYWFESGSPTFLVKMLRNNSFDVRKFSDKTIYASESVILDYTGDSLSPTPLLYQCGYLTISEYNRRLQRYTLSFPNEEVKYGFLNSMMPYYVPSAAESNGLDIFTLEGYVEEGDLDSIRNVLTALFASITYTSNEAPFEHYFQTVIYLVFTLLGKYTVCEMHTFSGRIDCKVETEKFIYLFEFKRDESAEAALRQIDEKDYALPFSADNRKVFKIGVSFNTKKRILSDWLSCEA